jgi:NADH dehydrogenase
MASSRIVIVGGGFAGVKCAKTLRRSLPPGNYDIVLFNRENHLVFQPLLAEVAGASIDPDAIAAPLRQMLPGVHCRSKEVKNISLKEGFIEFESYEGDLLRMSYDHLVLACGEVVNMSQVPGMADHSFPLRTAGDAIRLRYHVIQQLEKAEVCTDEERKKRYLSFIVLGGGFSGVEVAGEINDLVRDSVHLFENIPPGLVTVSLVHSHDQILPEVTPKLRDFARVEMEKAGIKMVLNKRASLVTPEGVGLNDGSFMNGATVVCTVGNAMSPIIERLDNPKEHGRLATGADMRILGFENAWAVGDCAYIINSYDNNPSPTTGQFAERQGKQAAENIVRAINGQKTRSFHFKPLGQLCAIGGHNAVAEILGIRVSGFLAWFLWRGVYLFKLPSWARRFKVGFDWAWDLLFSRDLAYPKANETERVSKAYYRPGDYVFHQGDPGINFYIIESGQVEVLRSPREGEPGEVISVLGPGDFFGEMALVGGKPRNASVRAKTAVEVVVMGKDVFTQISSSLGPLRDLISEAVRERRARQ